MTKLYRFEESNVGEVLNLADVKRCILKIVSF
jgi:hypothetical protein